jgi:pimeloyl-ACP methyl ester carboxylesterase
MRFIAKPTVATPAADVKRGIGRRPWRRQLFLSALAAVSLGATWVFALAQREILAAHRWIDAAGSQVASTPCGPIEYVVRGQGQPVLLLHGTSGGLAQGILLAERLGEGFQYVIPSRFGYFGTPLPSDGSPAAQAEAHVCLLDTLGVERAAVWAGSAGALSAMELAANHPDRVSRLVLLSPAAWSPDMERNTQPIAPAVALLIKHVILKSDFAFWLMSKVARPPLMGFLGIPLNVEAQLTADEQAFVEQIVRTLLTVSRQQNGLLNEAKNHDHRQRTALERIAAPTLILSAADDPFGTQPGAKYTAKHIHNAQPIWPDQGGHLLLGGQEKLWATQAQFLRDAGVAAR